MATGTTDFAALSQDAVIFIRDEVLDIAEINVVFAQHAEQAVLPQHNSKTIQFTRFNRFSLPQSPLTEGVTPTVVKKLTMDVVNATVDQWGDLVVLTDMADMTIKHRLMPQITELLGLSIAELVDREIQKVLVGSASVTFAGGKASRATLTASDVVNSVELRKLTALLRRQGAKTSKGGLYPLVVDVEVSQDIVGDDEYVSAHALKDVTALYNNVAGAWMGFMIQWSSFIPVLNLIEDGDWTLAVAASGNAAFGDNSSVAIKITGVNDETGFEERISNAELAPDVDDNEKINITFPSLTGYTYNVYMGDTNAVSTDATLHLISTGNAPAAVLDITTVQADFPEAATDDLPPASPPEGVSIHTSYAIGKGSYGMVKLSSDNLRTYVTPATPSDSDPLVQRRKLGYKGSFKSCVLNANFFERFESASGYDA